MSTTLPDPLLTLRSALSASQTINLVGPGPDSPQVYTLSSSQSISFPHLPSNPTYPKSTSTRYLSIPNALQDPNAPTYDLQTLLFGYLNRQVATAEYLRLARQEGVGFISVTDRKSVIEYLAGKTSPEGPEGRVRELTSEEREIIERELPREGRGTGSGEDFDSGDVQTGMKRGGAAGTLGSTGASAVIAGGVGGNLPPPNKKARYVPNKEDQEKVKRMISTMDGPLYGHMPGPNEAKYEKQGGAYHSRETVLRGERFNNFESVRHLVAPRVQALQSSTSSSRAANASTSSSAPGALKPQQPKKKQLNPIIIISPSSTALITMHNVKHLLEEATFVPSDEARRIAASTHGLAEDVVQVNHQRASGQGMGSQSNGKSTVETRKARYFVVDSVEALAKFGGAGRVEEAWDRVVCVMTTGQEWQFKPYKWKEPKELFHHVKGIYPQWTTDPTNAKIKSWNVSELRIDPHKRHIDKSVVADFWRNLETWIQTNKPWLSY